MPLYRFGTFELDAATGELRRAGLRVRLNGKPLLLLTALLERPGELVSRNGLQRRLWPDTTVDFDRGLNNAANRMRTALRDSAAAPRFIETVAGSGYRFIAPVEVVVHGAAPGRRSSVWLAAGVAAALALAVVVAATLPAATPSPARAEVLAGLYHRERFRPEALLRARELFERAVTVDPGYAPARAWLAITLLDLADWGLLPRTPAAEAARTQAAESVRLDPRSAAARMARSAVLARADWDLPRARREAETAVRLDPGFAPALRHLAGLAAARGRTAESIRLADRASEREPLSAYGHVAAGQVRYFARQFEAAAAAYRLALTMDPNFSAAHKLLSDAYRQLGREADAAREFDAWLAQAGVPEKERVAARGVLDREGFAGLWRRNLSNPAGKGTDQPGIPFKLAAMHADLGQAEAALDWLERAAAQRDGHLVYLAVDPQFDGLRGLPRYRRLAGRLR